jgi:hypothetical protein
VRKLHDEVPSPLWACSSPWPAPILTVNGPGTYGGSQQEAAKVEVSTTDTESVDDGHEQVAALQRWETSGAVWRVASRNAAGVTVALCRCDGGEEVSRFSSDEPELLAFLGDRLSSES